MALDQRRAPLFEELCRHIKMVPTSFHVPGHKRRPSLTDKMHAITDLRKLDLTEVGALDDLHAPAGVILEAQSLAAKAFGAAETFFIVGGSTAGLHALMLAAVNPGQPVALPRNAHRALVGALILSGARPVWIDIQMDEELGLGGSVRASSLIQALSGAKALFLTHPTYFGKGENLTAEINAAHERQVPVIVDEAHGTHFKFHPSFPASALSSGADATVQSTHKTGGSLTQSSMCHLGHQDRIDGNRVRDMLRLVQSTSPSYLLMASLDVARRELALYGHRDWQRALELAETARRQIAAVSGISVAEVDDPTRLVIDVRARGITGWRASQTLLEQGIGVEMSGPGYFLAIITPADTPQGIEKLIAAIRRLPAGKEAIGLPPAPPSPEVVATPREAYLGPKRLLPLRQAQGRIAAEMVAPYPPGISVLVPGERITPDVVGYLQYLSDIGYPVQGPQDPRLTQIQVLEE